MSTQTEVNAAVEAYSDQVIQVAEAAKTEANAYTDTKVTPLEQAIELLNTGSENLTQNLAAIQSFLENTDADEDGKLLSEFTQIRSDITGALNTASEALGKANTTIGEFASYKSSNDALVSNNVQELAAVKQRVTTNEGEIADLKTGVAAKVDTNTFTQAIAQEQQNTRAELKSAFEAAASRLSAVQSGQTTLQQAAQATGDSGVLG